MVQRFLQRVLAQQGLKKTGFGCQRAPDWTPGHMLDTQPCPAYTHNRNDKPSLLLWKQLKNEKRTIMERFSVSLAKAAPVGSRGSPVEFP